MEVDGAAALELGHLGIGDPDQPPQPSLVYADLASQARHRAMVVRLRPRDGPVREEVLSEFGVSSHYRQLDEFGAKATTCTELDDGKPVEL